MDDQALLSFGLWIKRRRKALDLTQDALAALVGCSKDLIVKIEGDARRPSREIAALLATQLQLAPEERDDFIPRPAAAADAQRAARCVCAGHARARADRIIRYGAVSVHRYRRQHAFVGAAARCDARRAGPPRSDPAPGDR